MNIVFMGTPEFAVPCLERLVADGHTVTLVVTQGDKPKGRGQKLTPPPVKEAAQKHGIPVFQPTTLKSEEAQAVLAQHAPDVMVVVAYGKLLPKAVLDLPKYGCINVHASLLPSYRGAAPIQWAVLNGDAVSGVTTMFMDEGLDTGDMLLKATCSIPETMTAGELHDRLSVLGAQTLSETLDALQSGTLIREKQGESDTAYAAMLDKRMGNVDFTLPARVLHNRVRGLHPWPGASVLFDGKRLKLHRTKVGAPCTAPAGTVVSTDPVCVACADGVAIELMEVQYEGGKRMAAADFFRGHPLKLNEKFDSGEQ